MLRLAILLVAFATVNTMVCFKGICDHLPKHPTQACKGSTIKNGGFCGCFDACAKVEGEECDTRVMRGRIPIGTCDTGLMCQAQDHMRLGAGKCVVAAETKQVRDTRTLCEQSRIHSLITMVVYEGKWIPKCDTQGLFHLEQCDNTGHCFCVDAHTGVVDQSTKVLGSADCTTKTIRDTHTLCEQKRMASMISLVVYQGQWFPKCDEVGLFEPEQCDNTGHCFCVDAKTGAVDQSTKVLGSADCTAKTVRDTHTLCEQKRMASMISMVVYQGQWFPKCDEVGLFEPEQCDNTGHCFCVDTNTGTVDQSTKVLGSVDCTTKTVRDTHTLCEQKRMASLISMVVYQGQWFPKCDEVGLFKPEQCDNTGTCFCVDVHTGTVDETTKTVGSASC